MLKANNPWAREDACSILRRSPGFTKHREELARQIVLTDGHALDEYRADTVRNLDPWFSAA